MSDREPLSEGAKATLRALLDGEEPEHAALRAQIPYAWVTWHCGCGCATVDLAVDQQAVEPAPVDDGLVLEGDYTAPPYAGVLLLVADGYLSGLEIYSVADEPVATWPDVALLTVGADS